MPDGIDPVVLTPPTQLQSLNGLRGLFEQMRQKFGDTTGYELHIDTDSAMLYRPNPQDSRQKVYYRYTGGWGDPSSSPSSVDSDDRLVDLAAFDYEGARRSPWRARHAQHQTRRREEHVAAHHTVRRSRDT